MKTVLTLILAGFLAINTFAADKAKDLIALTHVHALYKKIDVHLEEGVGKAKISILDKDGKKLDQRNIKVKHDLIIPYNLNALPCGEYQVMISTEDEEVLYTVETKDKVEPGAVKFPLMAYGKKIDINTISLTVIGLEEAGVEVKIFTEDGDKLIYQEVVSQEEGFHKDFKLNGVKVENVYMSITDAKKRNRKIYF